MSHIPKNSCLIILIFKIITLHIPREKVPFCFEFDVCLRLSANILWKHKSSNRILRNARLSAGDQKDASARQDYSVKTEIKHL